MNGMTKAIVVAMLVFISLVPAMAFVPIIPTSVEQTGLNLATGQITSDNAQYLYQRTVADAAANFKTQDAYSAVEFGALQGTDNTGVGTTGGEVANEMVTAATNPAGITRQYIAQTGTASVTSAPAATVDAEHPCETPVVTESMSSSNLAWMSGDETSFTAEPSTFGIVGGNYIDPAVGTVSGCGNVWLYETDPRETITITANNGDTAGKGATNDETATLMDAYAGTATAASLTAYPGINLPGSPNVPAEVTQSGYAEKFGGYDGADVGSGTLPVEGLGGSVSINFGTGTVTQGWNAQGGEMNTLPFPLTSSTQYGYYGVPNV